MSLETQSSVLKKASEPVKAHRKSTIVKKVIRKLYAIISSPIGLVFLLIIYSFIGAALFQLIEGSHELYEKKQIQRAQFDIIESMWDAQNETSHNKSRFRDLMEEELLKYEKQIQQSYKVGVTSDHRVRVWDFWGALFYAATIYTTIGYGHIAPATTAGRWATIIYAIIGIPLCLIILTDLGKLLTRFIKFLWSFARRLYFTGHCLRAKLRRPKEGEEEAAEEVPEEYVVDDEFNLPIIVAVIISVVYMLLGAVMYSQWENWTYLEAFYFIFISVSTIGFGDVLPEHPRYFLISSIYILIGLSLVAMVINVIMENMSATLDVAKGKISEVSRNIGLGVHDGTPCPTPVPSPVLK